VKTVDLAVAWQVSGNRRYMLTWSRNVFIVVAGGECGGLHNTVVI